MTVGLFIAGQMLVSLMLDATGWLGVAREPIGRADIAGAVAVTAGAALIVRAQARRRGRCGWVALALAAGAALPLQGAVNAQLRADLDAPITAGAWSFVVAAAAMVAVLAVARPRGARVDRLGGVPWWGWLGGALRRHLRDVGVPADPGDRRRADDRADGRRPAARVGVRRPLRAAAPAAAADPRRRLAGVAALLAGVATLSSAA